IPPAARPFPMLRKIPLSGSFVYHAADLRSHPRQARRRQPAHSTGCTRDYYCEPLFCAVASSVYIRLRREARPARQPVIPAKRTTESHFGEEVIQRRKTCPGKCRRSGFGKIVGIVPVKRILQHDCGGVGIGYTAISFCLVLNIRSADDATCCSIHLIGIG